MTDGPATPPTMRRRALRLLGHLSTDVIVGLVWAALIVAIVLFSGIASQFTYVDF
ncbi:MAG: hypothetical protein Q7W30_02615 [Coriobacteriia bacterium]|nr:hypothetical protein [Coriobacteriia bacterium]